MPYMLQQNQSQSTGRHHPEKLPSVLPEMQIGNNRSHRKNEAVNYPVLTLIHTYDIFVAKILEPDTYTY